MIEVIAITGLGSDWKVFQPVIASSGTPFVSGADRERQTRSALVIAVNDTYRIEPNLHEGIGGLARLRTLRRMREASGEEVLLLHAGDFLSPSLLSRTFDGKQMIAVLNLMNGQVGVPDPRMLVLFGNHEFDKKANCSDPSLLRARIRESEFRWLASNVDFDGCANGPMLLDDERKKVNGDTVVKVGGIRIGVFGLTIDLPANANKPLPPIAGKAHRLALARTESERLRTQGAEVVIALTHLDRDEDASILKAFSQKPVNGRVHDGPDLLIGGHDHERMVISDDNGRSGYKADSDAETASEVRLTIAADGRLDIAQRWVPLNSDIEEDKVVKAEVDRWLQKFEEERCGSDEGCLEKGTAVTPVGLSGDEREIRKNITTLGTWVSHEMLGAFEACGASIKPSVAFINSGSLRLNRDIRAGTKLTVRDIEELFGFETEARLVTLRGDQLKKIFEHSFSRRGTGGWLQFIGLTINRDPETGNFQLIDAEGRSVDENEYGVITTEFLLNPLNEDGFDLSGAKEIDCLNGKPPEANLERLLTDKITTAERIEVPPLPQLCEQVSCLTLTRDGSGITANKPPEAQSYPAPTPAH